MSVRKLSIGEVSVKLDVQCQRNTIYTVQTFTCLQTYDLLQQIVQQINKVKGVASVIVVHIKVPTV